MAWFLLLPTGRPSAGPGVGAPVFGEKQTMPGEGDKQDGEGRPTWLCPGSAHGVQGWKGGSTEHPRVGILAVVSRTESVWEEGIGCSNHVSTTAENHLQENTAERVFKVRFPELASKQQIQDLWRLDRS